MSKYQRGLKTEVYASKLLHIKGIPLLVSPVLLRRRGCAQIDLAFFSQSELEVFEIKLRRQKTGKLRKSQRLRLKKSCNFLTYIFPVSIKLSLLEI